MFGSPLRRCWVQGPCAVPCYGLWPLASAPGSLKVVDGFFGSLCIFWVQDLPQLRMHTIVFSPIPFLGAFSQRRDVSWCRHCSIAANSPRSQVPACLSGISPITSLELYVLGTEAPWAGRSGHWQLSPKEGLTLDGWIRVCKRERDLGEARNSGLGSPIWKDFWLDQEIGVSPSRLVLLGWLWLLGRQLWGGKRRWLWMERTWFCQRDGLSEGCQLQSGDLGAPGLRIVGEKMPVD